MSEPTNQAPATPPKRTQTTSAQAIKKTTAAPSRPVDDDREGWKGYWTLQGQPWRTEPEIDEERQKFLAERRVITPDIEKSIYSFKDIKLGRADVEWLLATHEHGHGPVLWNDPAQRSREGLDLRGADLRQADLRSLPLSRLRGGLTRHDWGHATEEQHALAAVQMEGTVLRGAHLEEAILIRAHMEKADLRDTHLEGAFLSRAYLEKIDLWRAHLEGSILTRTHLEGAFLDDVILSDETHVGPQLAGAYWNDVDLSVVKWSQVEMLGDEHEARQKTHRGKAKESSVRIARYEKAVGANRQLAVMLQTQGLNEVSDHFTYHAHLCQRVVFRLQRQWLKYAFSWLLAVLTGYGYRMGRIIIAYVLAICGFASLYYSLGGEPNARVGVACVQRSIREYGGRCTQGARARSATT